MTRGFQDRVACGVPKLSYVNDRKAKKARKARKSKQMDTHVKNIKHEVVFNELDVPSIKSF